MEQWQSVRFGAGTRTPEVWPNVAHGGDLSSLFYGNSFTLSIKESSAG